MLPCLVVVCNLMEVNNCKGKLKFALHINSDSVNCHLHINSSFRTLNDLEYCNGVLLESTFSHSYYHSNMQ
jgi:hypothetical protein